MCTQFFSSHPKQIKFRKRAKVTSCLFGRWTRSKQTGRERGREDVSVVHVFDIVNLWYGTPGY